MEAVAVLGTHTRLTRSFFDLKMQPASQRRQNWPHTGPDEELLHNMGPCCVPESWEASADGYSGHGVRGNRQTCLKS